MWLVVSWFLIALGLITLLTIIVAGLAIYCYSRLVFKLESISASPEFKVKPAAIVGSVLSMATGDFFSAAGAAAGLINGVRIDGQIACLNHGFLPLYLPDIDHDVSIGGKQCLKTVHTSALWLKPGGSEAIPVNMTISTNDIP